MELFLCFDCGARTLGVAMISINKPAAAKFVERGWLSRDIYAAADSADLKRTFVIEYGAAIDVYGATINSLSKGERAAKLKQYLNSLDSMFEGKTYTVLIEDQPSKIGKFTNTSTTAIEQQIAYHYALKYEVKHVSCKRKKTLTLGTMPPTNFKNKHDKNKQQAEICCRRLMENHTVKKIEIKSVSLFNNFADATLLALVYLYLS